MTSSPYIKLWAVGPDDSYPIVKPGSIKREFLDNTQNSHGYHCQPLTTANLHGWDFCLAEDLEVIWDGISNTEANHVKILKGGSLPNGLSVAETTTANATIAFNIHCYVETDPDHYLLFSGPPNVFVNGAKPMSALIRSDWYNYSTLQFCWQLTTPNKVVTFKAGMPFLRIMNYPKNLLETTDLIIGKADPDQNTRSEKYNAERIKFSSENPGNWPLFYKKGKEGGYDDAPIHIDKQYRPNPKEPRRDV